MKNKLLLAGALSVATLANVMTVSAQGPATAFLKAGVDDANKLFNAYLSPINKGFANTLNNGWYNTARPHGIGGFDVTATFGLFNVPSAGQTYNVGDLGLSTTGGSNMRLVDANTGLAPTGESSTIFGPDNSSATYDVQALDPTTGQYKTINTLTMPKGSNVNMFVSLPMAHLAVGVYKNTEVMLRLVPTITAGDFKAGMFGLGVKHDIKQWIPAIKEQKIWDLSGIFTYTSFNAEYAMSENDRLKPDAGVYDPTGAAYDNQKFSFSGSGWMLGTIVSAKLGPLTPYLGINYNNVTINTKIEGDYPITFIDDSGDPVTNPNYGKGVITKVSDPINIEGKASGLRANVGARLKILVLTLHYDYTFAEYSSHTIGVGLNLQSIVPFKL